MASKALMIVINIAIAEGRMMKNDGASCLSVCGSPNKIGIFGGRKNLEIRLSMITPKQINSEKIANLKYGNFSNLESIIPDFGF